MDLMSTRNRLMPSMEDLAGAITSRVAPHTLATDPTTEHPQREVLRGSRDYPHSLFQDGHHAPR